MFVSRIWGCLAPSCHFLDPPLCPHPGHWTRYRMLLVNPSSWQLAAFSSLHQRGPSATPWRGRVCSRAVCGALSAEPGAHRACQLPVCAGVLLVCWSESPAFLATLLASCSDGVGVGSDSPHALPQAGQLCANPTGHLAKQARHSMSLASGRQPVSRCRQPVCGQVADCAPGGVPVSAARSCSCPLPPRALAAEPRPVREGASRLEGPRDAT